jgi:serine protease Do
MSARHLSQSATERPIVPTLRNALVGGLASVFVSGCATQFATKTPSYSPTNEYHKVYLIGMEHDPRQVQPKIVSHLQEMGFEVEVVDPDKPSKERQGTGFVIGDSDVLTCAHVVGEEKVATIWLGGERFYGDVANTDTNLDLALVKVAFPAANKVPQLSLGSAANLKMGQEVYTIGFPLTEILGKSSANHRD